MLLCFKCLKNVSQNKSRCKGTTDKRATMTSFLSAFPLRTESIVRSHPLFPILGTPQEQEAFITKYSMTLDKIRMLNETVKNGKDKTKRISELVIDTVQPKIISKCQAVNLNNSPCKFKVSCGRFCKKHQISAKDLELV